MSEEYLENSGNLWIPIIRIADRLRERALKVQSKKSVEMLSGLTIRQQNVISKVYLQTLTHPEGIPLKQLAEILKLSSGTVSETVEVLVRKKALERYVCPTDRRAVRIRVASEGMRIIQAGLNAYSKDCENFTRTLTGEEQKQFSSLLSRFYDYLITEKELDK